MPVTVFLAGAVSLCSMSCGAHVPSPASSAWRMRLLMFRSGLSMIFEAQLYIEQWCGAAGAVDKWEWSIPSPGNTVERDVSFGQAGMLGWELTVNPCSFLSLTPFTQGSRKNCSCWLLLRLTPALPMSHQGHNRQSSGQALPPRVLHV